jgi:hypothetical protein
MSVYTDVSQNAYALRQMIRNDKEIYSNRQIVYTCHQSLNDAGKNYIEVAEFPTEQKAMDYYRTFAKMQTERIDGIKRTMIIRRVITDQRIVSDV